MGRLTATAATGLLVSLLLLCSIAHATKYVVGGKDGWNSIFPMEDWPEGKKFYVGDVLVFNYDYQLSNVVVVDQLGHDTCTVTKGAVEYNSGDDEIALVFGANYFICGYPDQCQLGMKLAINATNPPPPPPPPK